MSADAASPPDYDDLPDTRDLVPPTSDEIPIATLANTIAIRALRRDIREMREGNASLKRTVSAAGWRIATAIVAGGVTMAGAVVGVAVSHGEDRERSRHTAAAVEDVEERVTYLERKNDGRARRGRESEE